VAARVPEDPVAFWLGRLDLDTQKAAKSHFNRWMRWLNKQPSWEKATPRDLLVRQLESEDGYLALDLLQSYIGTLVLRKSSKRKAYSVVKSFFIHNRCALPPDPSFRIRGDTPPVQAKLTTDDIAEAIAAANLRYRSMILFKWQSLLDNERLIYTNIHCSEQILRQLKAGVHPIRIDLPGRKSNENDTEGAFYTFIGADAIEALREYFEKVRGWPTPEAPLWVYSNNRPVMKAAFEATWLGVLRRIGKIPKTKGLPGSRYGYNLHEMRDEATTRLHTHAKNQGFDMDCVKLWCGQVGEIDPLKYDKFYRDRNYVQQQFLLAEPYLNIVSNPNPDVAAIENEKMKTMQQRIEALEHIVKRFEKMTDTNVSLPL
jgi:hypothetical protein